MRTIIAAFSDGASAQRAIESLRARGIKACHMLSYGDGNILARLESFQVPNERAQRYAEIMRRGAPLLVAQTDDDNAKELADELDRMGSLDLDAVSSRWEAEGWSGYDTTAQPYDTNARTNEQRMLRASLGDTDLGQSRSENVAEGADLEVIEEKVAIGKRQVSRGGVRLRTFVVERPIQEEVELHEERIDITREPVDERISAQTADSTFTEDELVVTARGEEVVVGKETRVVERVHVGKTAETRTETVNETERRRDVEVEQLQGDKVDDQPNPSRR